MLTRVIGLLLAGVLITPITSAQGAIEEIAVIGTRSEQPQSALPGNVSVVSAEALQTLAAIHAQEALRQIPGVSYQRGNGQESLPAIRSAVLTGAGACGNILVLEETIPVRGAGFCNVNELFDTHFEQAGRLEVTRGASTAYYGSNALLGAINIHLPVRAANSLSLELGANDYRRAKASIGYGQNHRGRLYLTLTDDGGFREQSGYDQQKLSWRQQGQIGNWALLAGATLTYLDQKTAGFITGDGTYRDDALREKNFDPEAFRNTGAQRVWARFSKQVDNREWVITPYLRATDMDFRLHFLPGDPLEQNQQTGVGWQSSLTTQVRDGLSWSLGLDAEIAQGELVQTQESLTQGSAFLQATIPVGTHYDYQVDSTQIGGFAHLDWQFDPKWRLLAGGRLEQIRYDYDNRGLTGRTRDDGSECGFGGCRYSRPADRRDTFTHFSPKLELQYQLQSQLRWHVAVADAFRAPQATELYRLQRQQQVADLNEVRATHLETGFRWRTDRSDFAASLYQIKQRNVIIRDADFFNVDGQKIDSQGVELYWQQQWSPAWQTRLVASWSEHEYASAQIVGDANIDGNRVDTAPEWVASGFVNWQLNTRLSAEVEIQHVSDYFLEPNNLFTYPGHTLWHLRGRYQISPSLTAAARVFNAGDRRFAERADFTSFTGRRYFPGEPRSLFAELRWEF